MGKNDQSLKRHIHRLILERIESLNPNFKNTSEEKKNLAGLIKLISKEENIFLPAEEMNQMIEEISNEIMGLGPIEPFIQDLEITEIMINGLENIYIERKGKIEQTDIKFENKNYLYHFLDRVISPLGLRIDESSPYVDARLPDGSRLNAIIPPVVLNGPTITIRKFCHQQFTVNDFINLGSINQEMIRFLEAVVKAKKNIIISGGTGSGKTTFLNLVSVFIPDEERIITIEDAAELKLNQAHVISLERRPPNVEGRGEITIRDLVRNALRMRPDRIIVGEVRGGEALDMLQALNTGHEGCLSTVHANSPQDLISRLEVMVMMSGYKMPLEAIRSQIAAAINLVIHTARLSDGTRKVVKISELFIEKGNEIYLDDIFLFRQEGIDSSKRIFGKFEATGKIPRLYNELNTKGIKIPTEIFRRER